MYVHVLDKKKKKIQRRIGTATEVMKWMLVLGYICTLTLRRSLRCMAMRCLHAQIEHVNLYKIAVPVAN